MIGTYSIVNSPEETHRQPGGTDSVAGWIRLIWIALFLLPVQSTVGSQTAEVRFENFKVVYNLEDDRIAGDLLQTMRTSVPEFNTFFGLEINTLVTVFIANSLREFYQLAPRDLPEWSNGCFIGEQQTILLRKPEWYSRQQPLSQVLRHELVHLWLHHKLEGIPVPLWFNEGLAEQLSHSFIDISDGLLISNALLSGRLVELADVDSLRFFSGGRARLAYLESSTAVQFLQKLLYEKGFNWLYYLDTVRSAGFESALFETTGMDLIDFYWKWYRWLREKYRWFIIFNWENLIWVVMIIILLGALYAIRYRNRKRLMDWEEEEKKSFPENQDQITTNRTD